MALWVVKLGGSLSETGRLRDWLAVLADAPVPLVLVPGGGPFADAVRIAQHILDFGDRAAHRMAILGMEQYALALADLEPRLQPCATPSSIAASCADGRPTLWLPTAMAFDADDIAETWDLTSDSLAAWLAGKLGADVLVLVKAAAVPDAPASVDSLVASGLVDPSLPAMLDRFPGIAACIGHADLGRFKSAVSGGALPGAIVRAQPDRTAYAAERG